MKTDTPFALTALPSNWKRVGNILERGKAGAYDSSVTGDPCIVRDDSIPGYRMFYFGQKHVQGKEVNTIAQAVAHSPQEFDKKSWQKLGPIEYVNPEILKGEAHKPWILMDPYQPNSPVRLEGVYWLFMAVWQGIHKQIMVATARDLSGPWTVKPEIVVSRGESGAFDEYHADTVTAYWFEKQQRILIFYKGYPRLPQQNQIFSPYGSSIGVALLEPGNSAAIKHGKIIEPSTSVDHWATGWIGGIQLFPASNGGWYGLLNASPTPPASPEDEPEMREPAPSLGGWAYTAEPWPLAGWQLHNAPIERLEDVHATAVANGECVNFWRHHILVTAKEVAYLFYNSGSYGQERMFLRKAQLK